MYLVWTGRCSRLSCLEDRATKGRVTEARHANGKETVMQDSWNDGLGAKMIVKESGQERQCFS